MPDYSPNFTLPPEEQNTSQTQMEEKSVSVQPDDEYEGESKLVNLLIKISGGLIKDETQANYALVGLAIIIIIGSVIMVMTI